MTNDTIDDGSKDPTSGCLPRQGAWITFRVRDVCHPPAQQLVAGPAGNALLEGRVIASSRAATPNTWFVELELRGSSDTVIVRTVGPTWKGELDNE